MALKFKVAGKTDIGLVRAGNEDYLHLDREHQVFAVCDGMGGHQAGEVASMTASQMMSTIFSGFRDELLADPDVSFDHTLPPTGELLLKSIRFANREIHNRAAANPEQSGMGTTVVAIALEGDAMSVAHVGDSRAYRIGENSLEPLTADHSWIEEMKRKNLMNGMNEADMPGKNVITRALGVRSNVEVDYSLVKIKPGDRFMLCSDGLCGFADDEQIFSVIKEAGDDVEKICDKLVQLANDLGGSDNVTIISLEVMEVGSSNYNEMEPFTLDAEGNELLAIEDRWLVRINEYLQERESPDPPKPEGGPGGKSKGWLFLIFLLFAVVAVAIIYMASSELGLE